MIITFIKNCTIDKWSFIRLEIRHNENFYKWRNNRLPRNWAIFLKEDVTHSYSLIPFNRD